MKIGTTVRAARKAKGMTLEQLAHEIGTDAGNLSRFERGLQGAGQDVLERMLSVLGIELSSDQLAENNLGSSGPVQGQVPLISWKQAGYWRQLSDSFAIEDAEEWLLCPVPHGRRTFALRVRGLSMHNPTERHSFNDGDIIFVDPDRESSHRSLIVAMLADTAEATFKQLIIEDNQRFLMALNHSWPNRILPIDGDTEICGAAIAKLEPLI